MSTETSTNRNSTAFSMSAVLAAVWNTFLLLVWASWWGGLCFYAIVVVPIGTELIGSVEQGFITQRVTGWHNILTGVFLLCLVIEAVRQRSRILRSFGVSLAIIEIGLITWHRHLTGMMDFADQSVPGDFYDQHAIYLWITAAEWFLGIALAWSFVWRKSLSPSIQYSLPKDNTQQSSSQ